MESLVHGMLSNATAVVVLALAVGTLSRFYRRPALVHSLWLVVLLKLVTPPLVPLSLPLPNSVCSHGAAPNRELAVAQPSHARAAVGDQRTHDQLYHLEPDSKSFSASTDEQLSSTGRALPEVPAGPLVKAGLRAESTSQGQSPPLTSTLTRSTAREAAGIRLDFALARGLVAMPARLSWEAWVLIVVLGGAAGWWLLATVRIIRFHRMVKVAPPVPKEWQEQTDLLAKRLGVSCWPEARLVPGQVPPMLWAIGGRPKLLVPSQLWSTLQADAQTALLLHELAHLRRRDHWVRWLELIVGGLYWWHPAVWWIRRALREAEEQCCDAWVVWAMPRAARTYAAALLAALDFVSGGRSAPAAASATSGNCHVSCMKRRLRMIVLASTPKGLSWVGRLAVMGVGALILPLAPSWARDSQPKRDPNNSRQLTGVEDSTSATDFNAQSELPTLDTLITRLTRDDDEADQTDDKSRDAARRLENQAKELIEKLVKEFGPVGEEVRKALERAVEEVHKSLEKENPSPDDLRNALEKSQEEVRRAFEQGGPVDKELREAWDRSNRELREAWERAREDMRQVMRDRVEIARRREREQRQQARERPEQGRPEAEKGQADEAEARQSRREVENARREVRELEQQLRRATRRLEELDRREARRTQRRPSGRPRAEAEPPRTPGAPGAPTAPRPESAPAPGAEPTPAPPPAAPLPRPGQRNLRRPGVPPGFERLPGLAPRPDYERRFRDLEDKLNQLLKELKEMKEEQKPKTSAGPNPRVVSATIFRATIVG
jgi:beta-lactamase regulating signal transducer with metallopeptidase domain